MPRRWRGNGFARYEADYNGLRASICGCALRSGKEVRATKQPKVALYEAARVARYEAVMGCALRSCQTNNDAVFLFFC